MSNGHIVANGAATSNGAAISNEAPGLPEPGAADEAFEVDSEEEAKPAASLYPVSAYPRTADRDWELSQDSATLTSTRSIYAEDYDFTWENERRYCGEYYMPNDDDELTRWHVLHNVYLDLFGGDLTKAPLDSPPRFILDIGTGTGDWVMTMAEKYPECDVVGVDIAPVQDRRTTHNVSWEVFDAEEDEWARQPNTVDLVHLRNMSGAFRSWKSVYAQAFSCLRPDGWIEIMDWDDHKAWGNFMDKMPPDTEMQHLTQALQKASELSGRPRGVGHLHKALFAEAGFVDIRELEYQLPLHPGQGPVARFFLYSVLYGMEPTCLRLLTKYMGWDPAYVRTACEQSANELRQFVDDPVNAEEFVVKLKVVLARKPQEAEAHTAQAA